MDGPVFLTVREVAGILRVSVMTVYRLVHSGEIYAIRVGKGLRVYQSGVQDYLRSHHANSGPDGDQVR